MVSGYNLYSRLNAPPKFDFNSAVIEMYISDSTSWFLMSKQPALDACDSVFSCTFTEKRFHSVTSRIETSLFIHFSSERYGTWTFPRGSCGLDWGWLDGQQMLRPATFPLLLRFLLPGIVKEQMEVQTQKYVPSCAP